jgi:NifU-like protein
MWDYTEKVKDHFLNPRNTGVIEDAHGVGQVGSMACGDALKLMFKLDADGKIADAKFQTFGCASAIASSSALTEMIKGKTLEDASKITNQDIADYLGGLPEQKMHCSVMGMEALQAAIENYRSGGTADAVEKTDSRIVCSCFGVTEKEIEKAVVDNDLRSVEQVTHYTKAGGGCGGCHNDIESIIGRARSGLRKDDAEQKKTSKLTNIQRIKLVEEVVEREIRPQLKSDGGDIELVDIDGPRVVVAMRGACSKCSVAQFTLRDVVEAKLREFVSEDIVVEEETK